MKRLSIIWLCLIIGVSGSLLAMDEEYENSPAWLILEEGKKAFEEREFGEAFRFFRAAIEKARVYPEAYAWMAMVYEEEGEFSLAERHYLQALEESKDLYIPEERLVILYRLASMYEISDDFGKYEKTLRSIIDGDTQTIRTIALRNSMVRNLKESGINKLIELYRINLPAYNRAYASMGIFYYRTGRYDESIEYMTLSILDTMTDCIDDLHLHDPSYEVTAADSLLGECNDSERLSGFLQRSGFYMNLYYTGCALFAVGETDTADELWELTRRYATEREWRSKAADQLRSPHIEPILTLH